jgi:hypothetical protein
MLPRMIVDAWIQHPTAEFMRNPMFASLLKWRGVDPSMLPENIPDAFTLNALEAAGIDRALVSAWWGRAGRCSRTIEVAALVRPIRRASWGRLGEPAPAHGRPCASCAAR